MSSQSDLFYDLLRECKRHGFEFHELNRVCKGVYRGTPINSAPNGAGEVYIKVHPITREKNFRDFISIATEVGHPDCEIIKINNDYFCLLMDTVPGKPLSQLLPVIFLPLIWMHKKNQYMSAFRQIGRQLGRLHSHTETGTGPILKDNKRKQAIEITENLRNRLGNQTTSDIIDIFEQTTDVISPYALVYDDRTPHNIYFDGQTVSQIDCSCKKRSVMHDHRGVIIGTRLMAHRLPYSSSEKGEELIRAYLQGYEQTNDKSTDDISYLICHLYGIIKLLNTYDRPKTVRSKITSWLDPPLIHEEICRVLNKINGCHY